jgi:AbrB family looped-hinge helix DNA binding protein
MILLRFTRSPPLFFGLHISQKKEQTPPDVWRFFGEVYFRSLPEFDSPLRTLYSDLRSESLTVKLMDLLMSLVKVKTKGQVTIPTALRERIGLAVGDLLEASVEGNKITLTPKTLIDRRLAEGLEDVKRGRVKGPFKTADELIASLDAGTTRATKRPRKSKSAGR